VNARVNEKSSLPVVSLPAAREPTPERLIPSVRDSVGLHVRLRYIALAAALHRTDERAAFELYALNEVLRGHGDGCSGCQSS